MIRKALVGVSLLFVSSTFMACSQTQNLARTPVRSVEYNPDNFTLWISPIGAKPIEADVDRIDVLVDPADGTYVSMVGGTCDSWFECDVRSGNSSVKIWVDLDLAKEWKQFVARASYQKNKYYQPRDVPPPPLE